MTIKEKQANIGDWVMNDEKEVFLKPFNCTEQEFIKECEQEYTNIINQEYTFEHYIENSGSCRITGNHFFQINENTAENVFDYLTEEKEDKLPEFIKSTYTLI